MKYPDTKDGKKDESMKVHLVNLGCARNQVDSENMLTDLQNNGWKICDDPSLAHTIIINTCSFIESAADESIETILELAELKKTGACKHLVVAGCLPQRYGKDIVENLPEVDVFLGTGAFGRIIEAADGKTDKKCLLPDPDTIQVEQMEPNRIPTLSYTAYLKIAEGCSSHCTYCIIPKLRGKQKSRPFDHIVSEASNLIKAGTKEIVLISQDTTAYGSDIDNPDDNPDANLARLLKEISRISNHRPEPWIRFLYGHPTSINDEVMRVVSDYPGICSYYDIPVQHASDSILKKMGRQSSHDGLLRFFENIRKKDSAAVLRTTLITGFPGETDKDFEILKSFVETIRFDHLGVFAYSDSVDLPSHRLPDHVPEHIKEARRDELMAIQLQISSEKLEKHIDKTFQILIEESPEPDLYIGRTRFQAPEVDGITYVHSKDRILEIGSFADVLVTDALEYDLIGELV
ncbi:30S ribosomal protein S12 methylthiotransferase RimO [Desulfobacterales bacterium HSG16]|nr:30S ribosomal protein S12 methylthiotransferase RimO [Desulfobacterales bacterium HSG16]